MNMSAKTSVVSSFSTAPPRAQRNKLYYACYRLCTHWSFTVFITILIVANTIVLAMDRYPESEEELKAMDILNEFFTWAFVLEMVIKLIGLGFKEYARDSFNLFDALVVVLSLVDIIVSAAAGDDEQTGELQKDTGVFREEITDVSEDKAENEMDSEDEVNDVSIDTYFIGGGHGMGAVETSLMAGFLLGA